MDLQVKGHQPFGPIILEAKCPDFIVESLNDYIDNYEHDPMPVNLLSRNVKNPFIEVDYADEIGLTDFMNYLGKEYLDMTGRTKYGPIDLNEPHYYEVSKIDEGDAERLGHPGGPSFIDGWVNIYGESDFTPVHTHGGDLSSVMILKLPEDPEGQNEYENHKNEPCPNGNLYFIYDTSQSDDLITSTQVYDQYVGMVLLFPPNLRHVYYPHKLKGQERRTLSLNYTLEEN